MKNIHINVTTGASLFSILEELTKFAHSQPFSKDAYISLTIHAGVETLANKEK